MSKRWKVGLLGAGYIIDAHARALKTLPNADLVAVCDLSSSRANHAQVVYGIPNAYSSIEEMLDSELDVVHILLPPELHIAAAQQIIESGRHVFLEKPMGLDSSECQHLVELAEKKKVKLAVDHNFLYLRSYEKLRQQVKDGTLGKLDQITINWLYPLGLIQSGPFNNWMFRNPENIFFEIGPHLVSFCLDLCGPLERIQTNSFGHIDLPGGNRVYRRWHVHGQAGNTGIDLNLSVVQGFSDRSITVRGRAAAAKCDLDRDIYYRDEPSGSGLLVDNFMTAQSVSRQMWANGSGNLIKAISHTLRKGPAANPFAESVWNSIKSFYGSLDNQLDPRLDGKFGVSVISACEQIVQHANFEPAENIAQAWSVLPLLAVPTVLVLGGTGFIGKYLVRKLTQQGYGVRVVTRDMSCGQIALAGLPIQLMQGDLADGEFLEKILDGIDVVYHLAKTVGSKWEDYWTHDVLVTKKIAEYSLTKGIKRFIYTGTIDSYYSADKNEIITSDTPLDSKISTRNHYARSKAACECLLMEMYKQQNFPVVIFRPGIVIGKGCPPAHWGVGMFQSETRVHFWGNGKNKLPFVLVEDVAEGLALGLDKEGIEGQVFLLTDEPMISGRDYVEAVAKESGTRLRSMPVPIWRFFVTDVLKEAAKHLIKHPNRKIPSYRDWDSRSHRARYDNSMSKRVLGWRPVGKPEALVERGIIAAVQDSYR